MRLCSISSGSDGNCIYVGGGDANILVDAGISGKKIEAGLSGIDVDPAKLDAIFVTHEHTDHVAGIGVMARRYHIPIYSTVETIYAMLHTKNIGRIPEELLHYVEPDQKVTVKDLNVTPFSISHDAVNPLAYTFEKDGHKVGIATDLGTYDSYVVEHLKDSEMLLVEANHDVNMLQVGPYPYMLKQRILGKKGHLSNMLSANLLCDILSDKVRHIILGHLSKDNNYPDLAYETVKCELEEKGFSCKPNFLSVAKCFETTSVFEI